MEELNFKRLADIVNSLHPAIEDTDDGTMYTFRTGTYPDNGNAGKFIWLAGYFSEEADAWWCVGRGVTMYQAIRHLKRQLTHKESNEKRL